MSETKDKKKKEDDTLPKVSFWKSFYTGLHIFMTATPVLFVVNNLVGMGAGVFLGIGTLATQRFYDSVQKTVTGSAAADEAYLALILLGVVFLLRELLSGLDNFMTSVTFPKFNAEASQRIHAKMGRIDPVCLEDTKLQDQINKAGEGANTIGYLANVGVWIVLYYIPYLIFMAWYLNSMNPKFIFALICVFVPTLFGQMMKTQVISKFEDEAAPIRRRYYFYSNTIIGKEFFKETRLLGAFKMLLARFVETTRLLNAAEWKANKKQNAIELVTTALSTAGWGGIMYLLVSSMIAGEISIGAFAAVFSSIGTLFNAMGNVFGQIGNMAQNLGSARNYVRFMALPERGGVMLTAEPERGIQLRNVSFSYPNATEPSVNNVSLDVLPGETIAIVGENGAGKSTLVRLLIGFYKPTRGTVTVFGMDTSKADGASLFQGVSGVFQKYQKYKMTLSENVGISELKKKTTPGEEDTALGNAGIEVTGETFPEGNQTMLSREFDGVDLSGGQWQRVAIARGLYRAHNLVVLDEPTAAIDPIEESRIYKQFMEISRDKTAIIVTHRLGSVKAADRVIIMERGSILAAAPHSELLESCQTYADMYEAQAMWYEL